MKLRKLFAVSMATALSVGIAVSANAAELDLAWYAENNPDVVAELGNSPEALRLHYEMFGKKEGRLASDHDVEGKLRRLFNAKEYAALYPDVEAFYGEDEEAMFQHYISFGLLEARRPCEKVSQAAATALKTTVVEAMEKAGLSAVPGSEELAAVIEGNVEMAAASAEAVQALTQVTAEVEKAVAETVESTTASETASSGGGSSSSSSGSGSSTNTGNEPGAGGDSGDEGSTDDDETVEGTFSIKDGATIYAKKDGIVTEVTSGNVATYFKGNAKGEVSSKDNEVTFWSAISGVEVEASEAGNYVTKKNATMALVSGKKVYTTADVTLDTYFMVDTENSKVVWKEGAPSAILVGYNGTAYAEIVKDSTDLDAYLKIADSGNAVDLKDSNVKVYVLTAITNLDSSFTVTNDGNTVSLKNEDAILLGDKDTKIDSSNISNYVTGTAASVEAKENSEKLYSDAACTTPIAATNVFKVDDSGSLALKDNVTAYKFGGTSIADTDINDFVDFEPAATVEDSEE